MRKKVPVKTLNQCSGKVNKFDIIDGEFDYIKFKGTIRYRSNKEKPYILQVVAEGSRVAGLALLENLPKNDTSEVSLIDPKVQFIGYLRSNLIGHNIQLQDWQNACFFRVYVDIPFFSVKRVKDLNQKNIASADSIETNQWSNTDLQQTSIQSFKVTGSYGQIHDKNLTVTLKIKRGDAVYYRSGSRKGKQILLIKTEGQSFRKILPVSENWVTIRFSNPGLPKEFVIKIIDSGSHKDEWSAIGLKESGMY